MPSPSAAPDQLPPPLLDAIAARGGVRRFPAQAILINEGDTSDSLYIVLSGRLRVYASSRDGREVVLAEHGPGEYLGELSLDGEKRSASVKTIEPTTCCVVPGARAPQLPAEHPDFALHLTHKLIHMVRRLTEQVKSLALQDVYGRIARVLTELSDEVGDERVVRIKLTQQDIADARRLVARDGQPRHEGARRPAATSTVRDGRHVIHRKLPPAW